MKKKHMKSMIIKKRQVHQTLNERFLNDVSYIYSICYFFDKVNIFVRECKNEERRNK